MNVLITFIIGFFGWRIAKLLRFPAAAMIGSLAAVAVYNALTGQAYIPREVKVFTQSLAGMFIGLQLTRKELRDMKYMIKPILLLLTFYTINTLLCGFLIHYIVKIDLVSSLLACISGGVSDISLTAMDMNADLSIIVFLQTARLVMTLGIFPPWIKLLTKNDAIEEVDESVGNNDMNINPKPLIMVVTILIACLSGYIGSLASIPAATIIFSMITIAIINDRVKSLGSKRNVRMLGQIFSGALIGSSITMEMIYQLRYMFLPVIILMSGYLIVNFIYGFICTKMGWVDHQTALFCSCPAGVSDMVLLAGDLGADMKKTGIIHISRLVYSVSVMPTVVVLIASLFK